MMMEIIIFLVIYSTYHITSFPSIPGGDSGELVAEACQLGVPHPPGYPLFTLLAHIAMKMPMWRLTLLKDWTFGFDSAPAPAWKVNNMCSVVGALAAVFIYKSSAHLLLITSANQSTENATNKAGVVLAASSALLFAFSPLVWEYSVTAEVFAMNNIFCSLILWQSIVVIDDIGKFQKGYGISTWRIVSCMALGGLTCGLALSNQHTSVIHVSFLIVAIIAALVWYKFPQTFLALLCSAVGFMLGLSPYLYLVYASSQGTAGSWGDVTNLQGLFRHILRAEYGTFQLGGIQGRENWLERIVLYLHFTSTQTLHLMLPIIAIAIVVKFINKPRVENSTSGNARKNSKNKNKQSTPASTLAPKSEHTTNASKLILLVIAEWLFYIFIWHCIFSNLPLNAPMPYGVHARFWMQPNISLSVLFGVSIGYLWSKLAGKVIFLSSKTVEGFALAFFLAFILQQHFTVSNKSITGDIMSRYAYSALSIIPQDSLLLSHSDLDWNPIRYIRICESADTGRNITHVSLQLIPYPWFKRQLIRYEKFRMPDASFAGVSTDRFSEGNSRLIINTLAENGIRPGNYNKPWSLGKPESKIFNGGIYIEMQAINEAEIESQGSWKGMYTLVPWGSQYRIYPILNRDSIEDMHVLSVGTFLKFKVSFGEISTAVLDQYPLGTWEAGAISVFYDAQYQLGIWLLTYAIDMINDKSMMMNIDHLPIVVDRLAYSQRLLTAMFPVVVQYETINSPLHDFVKNSALANLRLYHVMQGLKKIEDTFLQNCEKLYRQDKGIFLDYKGLRQSFSKEGFSEMQSSAKMVIQRFVDDYPDDHDYKLFRNSLPLLNS